MEVVAHRFGSVLCVGLQVGLIAFQENSESLLVASFGVSKPFRRLGIGKFVHRYIENTARRMGKRRLEADVLRRNGLARALNAKHGFTFAQREKIPCLVRGEKLL